ncbi:MAG: hypothetical protein H7Y08_07520 [Rhizobiaceae bacterium]|nr:hypothetical protein [Rhizobiaceae bacterium]
MSSIVPSLPVAPILQPNPGQVQVQTTVDATTITVKSPGYKPLWLAATPGSSNSFELLGLRSPRAMGDLAAMLAEVSLSLEKSIDENRKNTAVSRLAVFAGLLNQFNIGGAEAQVNRKEDAKNEATQTRDGFAATVGGLNAERGTSSINSAARDSANVRLQEARIDNLNSQIGDLRTRLAVAPDDPEQAAVLSIRIGETTAAIASTGQEIAGIKSQLQALSDNGIVSGPDVLALKERLNTAENDMLTLTKRNLDDRKEYVRVTEGPRIREEIAAKEAEIGPLQTAISTFRSDVTYYTGEVAKYQALIDAELAKAEPDLARVAGLTETRDANVRMLSETRQRFDGAVSVGATRDLGTASAAVAALGNEEAVAREDLRTISFLAVSALISRMTSLNAEIQANETQSSSEDGGIEIAFEKIVENLDDMAARRMVMDDDLRARLDAASDGQVRRIEALALGLMTSLADLLSTAADLEPAALPGSATQQVGGRVRVAV